MAPATKLKGLFGQRLAATRYATYAPRSNQSLRSSMGRLLTTPSAEDGTDTH